MGKVKRLRQKYHNAIQADKAAHKDGNVVLPTLPLPALPTENIFADLNIDINSLNTKLNDDVRSVKSFKSVKSEKSGQDTLTKKEKLKIRRELLLTKISALNQKKKQLKLKKKRQNAATIGDTNPLHDDLPSLENFLKNRPVAERSSIEPIKKKGIEKASKRSKDLIKGVKIYKSLLKNVEFKKNPMDAILQHVKAVVQEEQVNTKPLKAKNKTKIKAV